MVRLMINYEPNKKYKRSELCKILDIEYDPSHSDRVIKDAERLVELNQVSKQYFTIVRELTDEEKIERWSRTEYKKKLTDIIYITLSESKTNSIRGSILEYFMWFHMVNSNFKPFTSMYNDKKRADILTKYDKDVYFEGSAMYLANEAKIVFKEILKRTFSKMEKELFIIKKEHTILCKINRHVNSKGEEYFTTDKKELQTNDDLEQFMSVSKSILQKNDFEEWSEVKNIKVVNYLRGEISNTLGYDYYYTEYELILNRDGLKHKVETDSSLLQLKQEINYGSAVKILNSEQGKLKSIPMHTKEEVVNLIIKI